MRLFSKSLSYQGNGKTSHKLRKNTDKRHIVKTKDTAKPNMQRTLKTQQENKQSIVIWDKDLNRHLTREHAQMPIKGHEDTPPHTSPGKSKLKQQYDTIWYTLEWPNLEP